MHPVHLADINAIRKHGEDIRYEIARTILNNQVNNDLYDLYASYY